MQEIRDDFKTILGRLPPVSVTASSPLQLTDFGKSISKEIDAKEWAEELASGLVEQVRGSQRYEIQEFAKKYLQEELTPNDQQLIKLRQCAYKKGLELELVREVLGIELRDKLLNKLGLPNE